VAAQADFFGCQLQYVDQSLIWLYRNFGALSWMKGCPTVDRLPGYDKSLIGNDNVLVLTRMDAEWKMIYWLCQNDFDGWALERVLEGSRFTYYFHFRDPGDHALARLAA
jgi:hypothetical protein